ncbi:MAG TPA: DUF1684 domain-containing protein [Vicinamibacteria bacterium]|nr:DUF1684 domain-containing protein [Vicinamibacteria bacterium]
MKAALLLLGTVLASASAARAASPDYVHEIEDWRAQREEGLRAPDGWLSVVGLHWLREGTSTVGSAEGSDIRLPLPAPPRVGTIDFTNGKAVIHVAPGVTVKSQDKPVAELELHSDKGGKPDVLAIGPVTLYVIERGGRQALRVKDTESAQRRRFRGLEWYPVREALRIRARFTPYDPPKKIPIANVLGMVEPMPSPGYVTFQLGGRELRLDPVLEEPDAKELFFILKDMTAGKDTYPAGRFLYAEMPKDGQVVLDFNKAYSPPCAFTSFATCPLPPRQNRLDVRIEAGEKKPAEH